MYIYEDDNLIFFDVDDTLVMWGDSDNPDAIEIKDPYYDKVEKLVPNQAHLKLLKRASGRGRGIVVWSHGGSLWAATVVKALGIEKFVNLVMTKPEYYVDDVPITEWPFIHLYLEHGYGKGMVEGAINAKKLDKNTK